MKRTLLISFILGLSSLAVASVDAIAASNVLVSHIPGNNNVGGDNNSAETRISGNGRYVVFASTAKNLGVSNPLGGLQVYRYDRTTGTVTLVSHKLGAATTVGNNASLSPATDYSGEHIVFASAASDLVASDTNTKQDVFLYTVSTDTVINITPTTGSGASAVPIISGDGRYVVFMSQATDLVAGVTDVNGTKFDVFLYEIASGKTTALTSHGNGESQSPVISYDGRYVVFQSLANNLVAGDSNLTDYDVFLYDTVNKTYEIINRDSNGVQATNRNARPVISDDGNLVFFTSNAGTLVPGDTNNTWDVFVRDRLHATTERVSIGNSGEQLEGTTIAPAQQISGDGRFVLYASDTTTLGSSTRQLYLYDRLAKHVETVSLTPGGAPSTGTPGLAFSISRDGTYFSFNSNGTDLITGGDGNTLIDVYLRDHPIPNLNPIAKAGADQSAQCSAVSGASVTLDGSASYDLDSNTPLTYSWSGPFGTVTGVTPTVSLPFGSSTITLTVTDSKGATGTDTVVVTISDTTAPSLTVPASPVTLEATSTSGAAYTPVVSASDSCSSVSLSTAPTPAYYPLGTTVVTATATDTAGNSTSKSFNVVVQDTTLPVVTAPADVVVEATQSPMPASLVILGSATAADIFATSIPTNNAPASYPLGVTTVTWSATDANGNVGTATQKVTITDHTAPSISIANVIAEASGTLTPAASVSLGFPVVSDLFGIQPGSVLPNAPAEYSYGLNYVTWSVIDNNGNSASVVQQVMLVDTIPPVVTAPADITGIEATGTQTPFVLPVSATATDAFAIQTIIPEVPAGGYSVGTTTVTWTAVDEHGNTGHAYQNVTVGDTTPPELTVPADFNVEATGGTTPVGSLGIATATDLVDGDLSASIVVTEPALGYLLGANQVKYQVTDSHGNSVIKFQTVTVVDTTNPEFVIMPQAVSAEATAFETPVSLGIVTASDALLLSVTNDAPAAGFKLGLNTVTWTATDTSGNFATATQAVTIVDTTKPVFTSVPADISVEATGPNTFLLLLAAQASDIFLQSLSSDAPAAGFPVGTTTVTWTAVDKSGNSATASHLVTVTDTTNPTLNVPANITVEANGNPSTVSNLGIATASDLVDGDLSARIVVTAPVGGYVLGANTVGYSVSDNAGNTTSGTQTVTVVDTTKPTLTAPANISVPQTGTYTTVNLGSATASDHYLASVTNNAPVGGFPVGTTTVTWTATDSSGNTTTATQTVTVTVSYVFGGFQQPVYEAGIYKYGRKLPVKIKLSNFDGSPAVGVKAYLVIYQTIDGIVSGTAWDVDEGEAADLDHLFRDKGDGAYQYNLETDDLAKGAFLLQAVLANGTVLGQVNVAFK